jgi:succinate dehydrogenase / fumarate reductase, cytochrome b subunit
MVPLKRLFTSSLGRKYLMGATGFALVLYIFIHLFGNLTLYSGNGDTINRYAARLHGTLGPLITVAEIGLLLIILLHVVTAIQISMLTKKARPIAYDQVVSKGGPTKNNVSSRNMIVSGLVLLVFLIFHVKQMRFGAGIEEGYTTTVDGVMTLDLYRKVLDVFTNIWWVIFYVASMLFFGFHYRHGFWSMFQSLGAMNPRWSKPIYCLGLVLALAITAGFLFIPIFIYANNAGAMGGAQ